MKRRFIPVLSRYVPCLLLACAPFGAAFAQEADSSLLRDVQGPFNRTTNLALQNDLFFNFGPEAGTLYTLNIEPTFPMEMAAANWVGMHRATLPVIAQPHFTPGGNGTFGLGDFTYRYYLFGGREGTALGGGLALQIPTATDTSLGTGKWSTGPSFGGSWHGEPWVLGALATQIWSFAGDSDRRYISQGEIRVFANYNMGKNFYLAAWPTVIVDWEAPSDKWRIPLGGGVGKLMQFWGAPTNLQAQAFYNVENMQNDANWSLRLLIQILWP